MPTESRLQLSNRTMSTRDELKSEEAQALSEEIQRRAIVMEEIRTALRIGLYAAFKNEVRTEQIFIEGDRNRKEIYFPACLPGNGGLALAPYGAGLRPVPHGTGLAYFRVKELSDLLPTVNGFREPSAKQSRLRDLNTLNVLIVPGVAFDLEGRRLGYGKGFYDDCLRKFRGKRIALAYEFQVVAKLPTAIRERVLDWIVTEKRVIKCQ